ncbi:MAG: hypothetical protein HOV68_17700 [Streptomycetaceae bacterium]|nr:hypothetical protein [Streptomycetaceae bacterium]
MNAIKALLAAVYPALPPGVWAAIGAVAAFAAGWCAAHAWDGWRQWRNRRRAEQHAADRFAQQVDALDTPAGWARLLDAIRTADEEDEL